MSLTPVKMMLIQWQHDNFYVRPRPSHIVRNVLKQSIKGYPESWNEKSSGKTLSVDSFCYVIDLGNGSQFIKGYVTVIR